jgi:hypothetical protein
LATFQALQFRCRLSDEQAAELCGVSPRTYRRWRSTGKPNAGCVRLLAVHAGYVPWDGWEVHGGFLFPLGSRRNGIAPGELFTLVYYRQAISEYRRRCEQLKTQVGQSVQTCRKFL